MGDGHQANDVGVIMYPLKGFPIFQVGWVDQPQYKEFFSTLAATEFVKGSNRETVHLRSWRAGMQVLKLVRLPGHVAWDMLLEYSSRIPQQKCP